MLGLDVKGGEQGKEWELPVLAAVWTAPKDSHGKQAPAGSESKGSYNPLNIHTPEIQILTENFGPK